MACYRQNITSTYTRRDSRSHSSHQIHQLLVCAYDLSNVRIEECLLGRENTAINLSMSWPSLSHPYISILNTRARVCIRRNEKRRQSTLEKKYACVPCLCIDVANACAAVFFFPIYKGFDFHEMIHILCMCLCVLVCVFVPPRVCYLIIVLEIE